MKGRKVIFASIWPLPPNSLDWEQNIYRGTIKVIHPHRKSQPFEISVNINHGFLLSVFIFHQNGTKASANQDEDDLQVFCEALNDELTGSALPTDSDRVGVCHFRLSLTSVLC